MRSQVPLLPEELSANDFYWPTTLTARFHHVGCNATPQICGKKPLRYERVAAAWLNSEQITYYKSQSTALTVICDR
jgi:hypothetical protein